MMRAARHRAGQFAGAVEAAFRPPDPSPAGEVLPPDLMAMFVLMPPADRRHGLQVLGMLRAAGWRDSVLLQAALMHDVGKAGAGITVWHRVARVLLRQRAGRVWRALSGRPSGWRRPFWALANHPERGAEWVETRGGDGEVVDLIRFHEAEAPAAWSGTRQGERHAALAAVDERC